MSRRRKLPPIESERRNPEEWRNLIKSCLIGKGAAWGCLNEKGELFRITTFESAQVPNDVVQELISTGQLELADSGFYKLKQPSKSRRRALA